jgi:hypothetical protein
MSSKSRNVPRKRVFLAMTSALLACGLLAGCQRAADGMADAAIEAASNGKVKVDRDGDKVVFKTGDGEMVVQGGEALPLPDDFPGDVYLPGEYAVNSVMDLQGVSVVGLRTPGKVPALFADARKHMVAQGWKETMAMQHSADSAMLAFEKQGEGDGARTAMLSFGDDGDSVQMSVQLRRETQ